MMLLLVNVSGRCDDTKKLRKEKKALEKKERILEVKDLVEEQNYYFLAQTALPSGIHSIPLSYGYNLKVSKDSITAYLPYFGRAYSAPIGMDEGGIHFTSTIFDYDRKEDKKGWKIDIKILDKSQNGYQLFLEISESGSASLLVSDNNRQAISFMGVLSAKP